jgi:aryl-alcohol dehydrogenase-like predicted oxidoreductase
MLLAFHMMHQNARHELLPRLQADQTGAVGMYVVRNIFARGEVLRATVSELCAAGQLPAELDGKENPLDFLIHDGAAETVADAAYRFVRHQAGVNVVVFGTGNPQHVHSNVASIIKPPLPAEDIEKIHTLFGHLVGVGLDPTPRTVNRRPVTAP